LLIGCVISLVACGLACMGRFVLVMVSLWRQRHTYGTRVTPLTLGDGVWTQSFYCELDLKGVFLLVMLMKISRSKIR